MATLTTNLSLTKPAGTDFYDISVQNANMDTLDTAVAGKANTVHVHPIYTTCATAAATAAKTATLSDFTLVTGAMVVVQFTNANTSTSATLNVNSTGAKTLRYDGANVTSTLITSGNVVVCVYDGTYWQVVSVNRYDVDPNSDDYALMEYGSYTGTGTTTGRSITFSFTPRFVIVTKSGGVDVLTGLTTATQYFVNIVYTPYVTSQTTYASTGMRYSVSGKTFSWSTYGTSTDAAKTMNGSNTTYSYVGFGYA